MVRRSALRGGLLPADVIHDALGDAIANARRDHDSAAFALLRVLGAPGGQPAVISELATMLAKAMPAADVLGSTAPDELAVLFAGASAMNAVQDLASAIGDEPLSLTLPAGRTITLNLAIGVAASPEHAATGDELYMAADAALASAVESGEVLATAR
jgi:diguanylate cyclase (GGDEF)-like protein